MPMTHNHIETMKDLLDNPESGINIKMNQMLNARDDIYAMLRMHDDVSNSDVSKILLNAEKKMLLSAQEIVELLSH